MNYPKVSVIIPVYNGADFLGEAIQSVLDQTYSNFEVIIVDDASTDHTADVVKQFGDPRIRYHVQAVNQGVDAARLRAINASVGEILAFLDQDDLFHPEKLQAHVTLLEKQPDVGFSYNARFELNHSAKTIREIWRPPRKVTLADLVLGFPIAPSDMVVRRTWVDYLDLSKEPVLIHGGEYVITGRLFMSGCKFSSVDRALNYRRYHAGRRFSNLSVRCEAELAAQQRVFADPRCPANVVALRNRAFKNTYRMWAYYAFVQDETALGQDFLRKAVRLVPSIVKGIPCELVKFFLICSVDDQSQNHALILKRIFAQLPPEIADLSNQYDWAVARGYLIKGVRAMIWDCSEDGRRHLEQAEKLHSPIDESFISQVTRYLIDCAMEFGEESAREKMYAVAPYLEKIGGRASVRQLLGRYAVSWAFQKYHVGEYAQVPRNIVPAVMNDPKYLTNRGVLSIFVRSILSGWIQPKRAKSSNA